MQSKENVLLNANFQINSLIPRGDEQLTSLYNINTVSSKKAMRILDRKDRSCYLDLTPNCHN